MALQWQRNAVAPRVPVAGAPPGVQTPRAKKPARRPEKLQQQAQQLAGTSQCDEKFIMYEIDNKM
ncbi:hypothetical protein WJ969_08755 [Achromobacter xylosoxidans]